jgi:hypothetical protein
MRKCPFKVGDRVFHPYLYRYGEVKEILTSYMPAVYVKWGTGNADALGMTGLYYWSDLILVAAVKAGQASQRSGMTLELWRLASQSISEGRPVMIARATGNVRCGTQAEVDAAFQDMIEPAVAAAPDAEPESPWGPSESQREAIESVNDAAIIKALRAAWPAPPPPHTPAADPRGALRQAARVAAHGQAAVE